MARVDTGRLHVLGARHHGPGSARSVGAELERIRPELVLVEGPPEADALVALVGDLAPPVSLLAYVPDQPSRAAFWPLAAFSPEWVALRYAAQHGVEVRFCDLPAAHTLAGHGPAEPAVPQQPGRAEPDAEGGGDGAGAAGAPWPGRAVADPLAVLAEAASYDAPERWWEDAVEGRAAVPPSASAGSGSSGAASSPFPAIAEAMAAVRAESGARPTAAAAPREARREAHMRRVLREAMRSVDGPVAVVCGAWHVPALLEHPRASEDTALLRGLPKTKIAATWIPWTHGRLASASGYGAGVRSSGRYHHLFTAPDRPVERWLAEAGRRLREMDQPASSAHVIEAVRLTETLATLRGRPAAGLEEVADAAESVLYEGARPRAHLLHREMALGERMGAVSEHTPQMPDLARAWAAGPTSTAHWLTARG